uniref:Serine protease n=1 Tax=Hucho hucho TaxID=62062 RepID=A0A4W5L4Q6_9TELE
RTSPEFKNMTKKNQGMEVVIQREKEPRGAVSTHFPCHLIDNNELMTVSFIKDPNGSYSDTQGRSKQSKPQKRQPDKLMALCVETEGGKAIKRKVMKNPELKKKVKYVCVYGYKGETVKQALRRDGRFDKTILKTRCVLSEPETSVDTEMSQPVDGLDRKSRKGEMLVVKVKRIGRVSQPQPDNGSSQVVKQKRQEIPNSKEILNILRSQYAGLVAHMKDRENLKKPSDVQQFFRVEFGKKTQSFQEVKKVKRLIELSASVCQVRIGGTATGTGFLLFDKFILTNAHVVQQIYEQISNMLQQSVTVTFDFEDLDEKTQQIPVKSEVVAYGKDYSGYVDFALLELRAELRSPCLQGGICIIGHPDGGVKKKDPCFIIQHGDREQAVEKHVTENKELFHVINNRFFQENWNVTHLLRDTENITYDTCFFHGASGSPVFNEYCQLTAMHTGGYSYQATDQGEQRTFHQFLFDKGDATGVEAMEVDDDQWWKKCPVVIFK